MVSTIFIRVYNLFFTGCILCLHKSKVDPMWQSELMFRERKGKRLQHPLKYILINLKSFLWWYHAHTKEIKKYFNPLSIRDTWHQHKFGCEFCFCETWGQPPAGLFLQCPFLCLRVGRCEDQMCVTARHRGDGVVCVPKYVLTRG